jgi:hypothetical protein
LKWLFTMALAVAALGSGLIAARKWYAASKIQPKANWRTEPVAPVLSNMGWTSGTLEAFERAGQLNAKAALWTAASVVLSALSAIAGAWPISN